MVAATNMTRQSFVGEGKPQSSRKQALQTVAQLRWEMEALRKKLKLLRDMQLLTEEGRLRLDGRNVRLLRDRLLEGRVGRSIRSLGGLDRDIVDSYGKLCNLVRCIEDYQRMILSSADLPTAFQKHLVSSYQQALDSAASTAELIATMSAQAEEKAKIPLLRHLL